MQRCTVDIRMGTPVHTAVQRMVSPAEIVILKALHGDDAVANPRLPKEEIRRGAARERDELAKRYGDDKVKKFFPGFDSKLPMTMAEVGVDWDALKEAQKPAFLAPSDAEDEDEEEPETEEERLAREGLEAAHKAPAVQPPAATAQKPQATA